MINLVNYLVCNTHIHTKKKKKISANRETNNNNDEKKTKKISLSFFFQCSKVSFDYHKKKFSNIDIYSSKDHSSLCVVCFFAWKIFLEINSSKEI